MSEVAGPPSKVARRLVKVLAIIERPTDGASLVAEDRAPGGEVFHRPLGGGVEKGERAQDAVRRELREELADELEGLDLVGVLENHFEWGGEPAEEVDVVYRARLADASAYALTDRTILDSPDAIRVLWRPPDARTPPLYPAGLLAMVGPAGRR
jgi:ADP-ribose pyrophosphatase YjhB (NUDIX family)